MLCQGDVSGVFQLSAQAQKVMEQKPRNFRDLIAINALIRPGVGDWEEYIARRKGKKWDIHPERFSYMEETQGTMTYQEQFLLDAKVFAGWEVAYSDQHIRKNRDIKNDIELKQKFLKDATSKGHKEEEMLQIWAEIEDAVEGGYSFNKAHSTVYARTSFQTAYLKFYYPEQFYASIMTSEPTDAIGQANIAGFISECKQRGIKILPPDINKSGEDFVVTKEGINYRITTISHVGDSAIKAILAMRPIKSFDDFLERREKRSIKKNVVRNIIKAGCFDFENENRAELLWKFEMRERTKKQIKEDYQCEKHKWNDKTKAEWEKESLGMYLSTHPMEKYGFRPIEEFQDGGECLQGGEIYDTRIFNDKNGNEMAFIFISTLFGNIKIVIFSSMWNEEIKEIMKKDNIIMVKGRRSGADILLNSAEVLEQGGE